MPGKKKHLFKRKHGFALAISFGLLMLSSKTFPQKASPISSASSSPREMKKKSNPLKKKVKSRPVKNGMAAPTA